MFIFILKIYHRQPLFLNAKKHPTIYKKYTFIVLVKTECPQQNGPTAG